MARLPPRHSGVLRGRCEKGQAFAAVIVTKGPSNRNCAGSQVPVVWSVMQVAPKSIQDRLVFIARRPRIEGGSLAVIFGLRSTTRWLCLSRTSFYRHTSVRRSVRTCRGLIIKF